jgi:threonine aldolase
MKFIDLRSDTVTHPTPEMRQAMAQAEVGDDVYGDDPTVNRLQELAAAKLGKEAALFVPSGTMGNLVAILTHCQRGDEVIVGDKAHTFWYEGGGISAFGGVHSCQLTNQADGSILVDDIAEAVREDDIHQPVTRLVCLENTHNRCGGSVQSLDYTRQVSQLVHERGLKLHLDGARLFNAAAALNVEAGELTQYFDTVTFCLSKGLCCPVGSILCGPREFIGQARRVRKHLGGGMRQVGVLAAAGIVALEQIAPRMGQDHARARKLAEGLAENRGLVLDEGTPQTNMVYFNLAEQVALSAEEVSEKLKVYDILASGHGRRFRLVTHYWIDDAAVKKVVKAFGEIVG